MNLRIYKTMDGSGKELFHLNHDDLDHRIGSSEGLSEILTMLRHQVVDFFEKNPTAASRVSISFGKPVSSDVQLVQEANGERHIQNILSFSADEEMRISDFCRMFFLEQEVHI